MHSFEETEHMKKAINSKTLWFNGLTAVIVVLQMTMKIVPEDTDLYAAIALLNPLVNGILRRWFTNQAIK